MATELVRLHLLSAYLSMGIDFYNPRALEASTVAMDTATNSSLAEQGNVSAWESKPLRRDGIIGHRCVPTPP